jgi:hypothetical protein
LAGAASRLRFVCGTGHNVASVPSAVTNRARRLRRSWRSARRVLHPFGHHTIFARARHRNSHLNATAVIRIRLR